MTGSDQTPSVELIGVYSPKANRAEYEAFLRREVESLNPINFSDEVKAILRRNGRAAEVVALTDDELAELREELDAELGPAVLVEVLVSNPDSRFSLADFVQPDPTAAPERWQVAWNEKFLTADGLRLLGDFTSIQLPAEPVYRVAFYIHDWKAGVPLYSSFGPLRPERIDPMPQRLWILNPYERVD